MGLLDFRGHCEGIHNTLGYRVDDKHRVVLHRVSKKLAVVHGHASHVVVIDVAAVLKQRGVNLEVSLFRELVINGVDLHENESLADAVGNRNHVVAGVVRGGCHGCNVSRACTIGQNKPAFPVPGHLQVAVSFAEKRPFPILFVLGLSFLRLFDAHDVLVPSGDVELVADEGAVGQPLGVKTVDQVHHGVRGDLRDVGVGKPDAAAVVHERKFVHGLVVGNACSIAFAEDAIGIERQGFGRNQLGSFCPLSATRCQSSCSEALSILN